ncbi:polysaccharide deacetylase family protein [Paenibacillus sp. ALJ109b]|uniref:polysaccharide deacetylase family protein n=1 Tax=Paenibacillus sp. ALJ109b TaxID=2709068 RepID=UPI0013D61AC7|nr:polysaccharide deacetylase family protein [Paenibacillus sp. ALJ109b]NEU61093.1 polysaccharide deacetylase family protein [Paenibacillus sp. ALJ109b]
METYITQVMELLSLGKTSDGVNQITVAVSQEDRQAIYEINIDEFTYLGLEVLKPLNGDRIRLSPYSKWDPYRNTFYSSIIRTTEVSRDVQYFACSEAYINEIKRIRNLPPVPVEDRVEGPAQQRTQLLRQFSAHMPKILILSLVTIGLLIVLSITSKGNDDSANTFSGSVGVAMAGEKDDDFEAPMVLTAISEPYKTETSVTAARSNPIVLSHVSDQPDSNHESFEVIDIDKEESFFGLPKEYVALTFDDGPSTLTKQFVDILTEEKVAATFLFVGQKVERNQDAVIYASEHGMAIGNHSWDHSLLPKDTPQDQSESLSKTNSVLESLTHKTVTLFRPPYGAVNNKLVSEVKKLNMKTLLWNRDPEDWNAKNPEDIIRYFHQVEAAGGVYVLHENKNTLEALPAILKHLKEKNLKFVIFK